MLLSLLGGNDPDILHRILGYIGDDRTTALLYAAIDPFIRTSHLEFIYDVREHWTRLIEYEGDCRYQQWQKKQLDAEIAHYMREPHLDLDSDA